MFPIKDVYEKKNSYEEKRKIVQFIFKVYC